MQVSWTTYDYGNTNDPLKRIQTIPPVFHAGAAQAIPKALEEAKKLKRKAVSGGWQSHTST